MVINTIRIPIEDTERFCKVVAGLMREGIKFDVADNDVHYYIELKGY